MRQVLEGIKVVDLSHAHVGPFAAAMLGDLGAEVIHVEERGVGDMIRGSAVSFGVPIVVKGRNYQFEQFNTNKRGLALDLKKPEGREIIYRLIKRSDVFLSNMRAKAVEKLGLDYETVKKLNPNIIYASAPSAFGPKGPDKDKPGLEIIPYARSGAMMSSGEDGMGPVCLTVGLGDRIGAIYLAYGTLAALMARERFGIAQKVDSSELGGMINLMCWTLMVALFEGKDPPRQQRTKCRNPLYNWYLCKDGVWAVFAMFQSQRYWPAFCQALGISQLENDLRFFDEAKRTDNCEELIAIIDKVFATRTYEEWEKICTEKDMLFSRVNNLSDLPNDPQVIANQYLMDWDHPVWGKVKWMGFPFMLSETPPTLKTPAPELGQHNEEILLELGYTWDDITRLRDKEVI